MIEWISVDENLPELNETILVWSRKYEVRVCVFRRMLDEDDFRYFNSHWAKINPPR